MTLSLEEGFDLLLTDPEELLNSAFLSLQNLDRDAISGVSYFLMSKPSYMQKGWTRLGSGKAIPVFVIAKIKGKPNKSDFGSGDKKKFPFQGYFVAMKQQSSKIGSVPAGTLCALPANGNHDLCITAQLSGCTFGIGSQSNGGSCLVTHIQPKDLGDNITESKVMLNIGDMAYQSSQLLSNGTKRLIEKYDDYAGHANVIGKRNNGGRWKFYMQNVDLYSKTIKPAECVN